MIEREIAAADTQGLVALTAFNSPVYLSYATLTDLIRQRLGERHAHVFARPTLANGRIVWTTPVQGAVQAWCTLAPAQRAALDPRRKALGTDLAALAKTLASAGVNTRDGNLGQLLQCAMEVPSPGHVYAIGDQLVLAFWGFRSPEGRIDPFTAPLPPPPVVRRARWWLWLIPLLALLAAAAWLFWPRPFTPPPMVTPPPAPRPVPVLSPPVIVPTPPPAPIPEVTPPPAPKAEPPSLPPSPAPLPAPAQPPTPKLKPAVPRKIVHAPPAAPPKNTQPCNQDTASGGSGVTRTHHYLGPKPGMVAILYDMFNIPDDLKVFYQGRQIASSGGFAYHRGRITFDWNPPANASAADSVVDIVVTGGTAPPNLLSLLLHEDLNQTKWVYRVSCPE